MTQRGSILSSAADQLERGTEKDRYQAVRDLAQANSFGAIPLLLQVVGDESYRIREEALKGICAFPPEVIFPRLESFLRNHDDAQVRNAALEAFPRYGEKATSYLLELLRDFDDDVRIFSATMLGEIRDPLAVEGLAAALKDPQENVRHAAAESLGKIRDRRGVAPLIECLQEDFWTQYPAVVALGEIGDPIAIEPLITLLEDEMLRQAVIRSLGKIGDPSAIPVLAGLLTKPDPETRDDTIAALVRIQQQITSEPASGVEFLPRIAPSLQDEDVVTHLLDSLASAELEIRKNAVVALGWLRENRAIEKLIELLEDFELEEYVVGSLVSIGEAALPHVIKALAHPEPRVRAALIRCLDWIGIPDGLQACRPFLTDAHEEVRYQAVTALGGIIEHPEIEDALLALLENPDPEFRAAVIEALGNSGSAGLKEKIIRRLSDGNPLVRLSGVRILARLRDPEAIPFLQELLSDEDDEVRAHAYSSVGAIAPGVIPPEALEQGISDEVPLVRSAAVRCLAASGGKAARGILTPLLADPDPQIQLTVIEVLGKIGDPDSIAPLGELFKKGDRRIQLAVIRALGSIRSRASSRFLTDVLKDADQEMKRVILESLGNIRERSAIPGIIVALGDHDWRVRISALWALGKIGDRTGISHLITMLNDPEDIIRKETITTLADLGAVEAIPAILLLLHHENLTFEVITALEKLGIPHTDSFYDFLKRSPTHQKCLLVDMLGRMQERGSIHHLGDMLLTEPLTVRVRITRALGNIGDSSAIASLIQAQKEDPNPEVRKEAALALTKLNSGR